ncbi:MAG: hypothetical protein Q4G71_02430 [Pseudomonadota bacterium]|nr:hypothetical protein [Pseudomonadota bacterium]
MKKIVNLFATLSLAALPLAAVAHEGHGQDGAHWHATDAWGFVAAGVAAAIAFWYFRRK